MEYKWDSNEDSCEAIDALELEGGSDWNDTHNGPCRGYVKWKRLDLSSSFDGCGGILPDFPKIRILDLPNNPSSLEVTIQERARENCVTKVEALFKKIDDNVELEGMPGFMFSN